MNPHLVISDEVRQALAAGRAVVALESTLIAHGLPWPENLETARAAEQAIYESGAVPATIAVLAGKFRVDLTPNELEILARPAGRGGDQPPTIAKASRRDLPLMIAAGRDAATTVAGSIAIAAMAGIRILATGDIGGVHRGAGESFDISSDLMELARCPVAVVCSGAKSILDLRLTLEVLETYGVPVIGYRTDEFPAFYARSSGLPVSARVDAPEDAAAVIRAAIEIGQPAGLLVTNPVPTEFAIAAGQLEAHIQTALADAARMAIAGPALTPFLLARLRELTAGRTLAANRALVVANARLAGEIACALSAPAL